VNPLDDASRETFETGRPLEDLPDMTQCKHCRKNVLRTAAKEHIAACLRIKKEKAQRKKEAREARERAREAAREQEARKADEDGDGRGDDDSDAEEEKKTKAGKTTKKAASKKVDSSVGGKKRKAETELEKGKAKKKKDEPKAKTAKPKGEYSPDEKAMEAERKPKRAPSNGYQDRSTSSDNVVSFCLTDSPVPGLLPVRAIVWAPSARFQVDLCPTTFCWQHIRRRTRRSSRVSFPAPSVCFANGSKTGQG
jgi:hypothetical protein